MNIDEMLTGTRDAITVKRVYGDPIERDGILLIPAAAVQGGAGGGGDANSNGGGGFGVAARPVGAYVIRAGEVTWEPAIDVNRVVARAMTVAIIFLMVVRSMAKARAKAEIAALKRG